MGLVKGILNVYAMSFKIDAGKKNETEWIKNVICLEIQEKFISVPSAKNSRF